MVASQNVGCFLRQINKPFPFDIGSLVFVSINDICDLCLQRRLRVVPVFPQE